MSAAEEENQVPPSCKTARRPQNRPEHVGWISYPIWECLGIPIRVGGNPRHPTSWYHLPSLPSIIRHVVRCFVLHYNASTVCTQVACGNAWWHWSKDPLLSIIFIREILQHVGISWVCLLFFSLRGFYVLLPWRLVDSGFISWFPGLMTQLTQSSKMPFEHMVKEFFLEVTK